MEPSRQPPCGRTEAYKHTIISPNQAFVPFDDATIRSDLTGRATGKRLTSLLVSIRCSPGETCWFLAADFDKKSRKRDILPFRDTVRVKGVTVAIERSRSGNGAHPPHLTCGFPQTPRTHSFRQTDE